MGVGRGTGKVSNVTTATKTQSARDMCRLWQRVRAQERATHASVSLCRQRRNIDVMDANHSKSGPIYEKTVRTSYEYWLSEMKRLDLK